MQLRDKGCSFPGCTAPSSWCDGHHITHWAAGGRTDLNNLALLCRHHHVEVHRKGHTATVDDDAVHWVRSDGTPIGNRPRPDTPLAGTA
ncbi:HNH endonuclease signature motif containing protein [Mobilicoccus caccae]|uniref:HNH endonuclease signature motif containing protein n=1 Tax=Mobilicoccus caccae TaxID=1859295 RepID=UPI0032AEC8F2